MLNYWKLNNRYINELENIFSNHITYKGFVFNIYEELMQIYKE